MPAMAAGISASRVDSVMVAVPVSSMIGICSTTPGSASCSESSSGPLCSRRAARPGWLDRANGRTIQSGSRAAAALMSGSTLGDGSNETIRPV